MQVVGLTGNIGSGKSTIAKAFMALGIPVFNSDDEAKKAYAIPNIQNEVREILCSSEGKYLDFSEDTWKSEIAAIIFSDEKKRTLLEKCIHAFVQESFNHWKSKQNSPYIIREAALAASFHSENCDWLIEVYADRETRLRRVIQRSGLSEEQFNQRDLLQKENASFPSSKKIILDNNDNREILAEVLAIHEKLKN